MFLFWLKSRAIGNLEIFYLAKREINGTKLCKGTKKKGETSIIVMLLMLTSFPLSVIFVSSSEPSSQPIIPKFVPISTKKPFSRCPLLVFKHLQNKK